MKKILFLNEEQFTVINNFTLGLDSLTEENLITQHTANFVYNIQHGDNCDVADAIITEYNLNMFRCDCPINADHVTKIPLIDAKLISDGTLVVWAIPDDSGVSRTTNYMLQHNLRRILVALSVVMSTQDLIKTKAFTRCVFLCNILKNTNP